MNLVDSCGWLEYFVGGPNAAFFEKPLRDTGNLIVPTICIYEVTKHVLQRGHREEAARVLATMQFGQVVDLDIAAAVHGAEISSDLSIPLADSIILATARLNHATLWTQDAHFKNVDGVKYIARK
jgi:toxin FitB